MKTVIPKTINATSANTMTSFFIFKTLFHTLLGLMFLSQKVAGAFVFDDRVLTPADVRYISNFFNRLL
jgi:hypothetical protein